MFGKPHKKMDSFCLRICENDRHKTNCESSLSSLLNNDAEKGVIIELTLNNDAEKGVIIELMLNNDTEKGVIIELIAE